MTTKHTPGPWGWEEDEDTWQLFGGSGAMPLQFAKCPKGGTRYAEYWPNEADSHLIVAAPDLLEACKLAYSYLDSPVSAGPSLSEVEDKLERAVAKALGKE